MFLKLKVLVVALLFVFVITSEALISDESQMRDWLNVYNTEAEKVYFKSVSAAWVYNTNLTSHNQALMEKAQLESAEFSKVYGMNASQFDWKNSNNSDTRRQFSKISQIGIAALNDSNKIANLTSLLSQMESLYSKAKVCLPPPNDGTCVNLDPNITHIMRTSRKYDELLWAWNGWHEAAGKPIGELYPQFVELSNEAARANGWSDTGEDWRSWYESATFRNDVEELWQELKPLYRGLHQFVRRWLNQTYGAEHFPSSGHIPAHLLGNMWAQSWGALFDDLRPFKDKESVDVTPQMVAQGYTALKMFNISDEFFTSLGLEPMPQEFWDKSMIEKPTDGRDVVCHASAWDFYNRVDFRVKQCTVITMDDLITVHHEMGHIEYYLQYKHQPVVYRRGANPGFHEAVGDVLALSVSTPDHLYKIGLLDNVTNDDEADINYLLSIALDKIAFLPFGYLMDQWRWAVFNGSVTESMYNDYWWKLRCHYQGIYPPSDRSHDEFFDPGSKYHIPGNTPYIRYFVSFVLQFQFHKALCAEAGEYPAKPLFKCDIYQSTDAGDILRKMLREGSSRPWPEVLLEAINTTKMDVSALTEYFEPLTKWLNEENAKYPDEGGWDESSCPQISMTSPSPTTSYTTDSTDRSPMPTSPTQQTPMPTNATQQTPMPTNATQQTPMPTNATQQTPMPTNATQQTPMPTNATQQTPMPTNATHQTPMPTNATHQTPMPTNATQQTPMPTNATQQTPMPTNATHQTPMPTNATHQTPMPTNATQPTPMPTNTTQTPMPTNATQSTPMPTTSKTSIPTTSKTSIPATSKTSIPTTSKTSIPTDNTGSTGETTPTDKTSMPTGNTNTTGKTTPPTDKPTTGPSRGQAASSGISYGLLFVTIFVARQ